MITVNLSKAATQKKFKIGFQDRLSLNVGQKYCRMFHSAILSTFIKLPVVVKTFVLPICELPFYCIPIDILTDVLDGVQKSIVQHFEQVHYQLHICTSQICV